MTNQEHIALVGILLHEFSAELLRRAEVHDKDKLTTPELSGENLASIEYGSAEYAEALQKLKPILARHYACNRHHPEHFENGIRGMNLVDLVEMFVDWFAACRRSRNGNIFASIEINRDRFEIPKELCDIFRNTVSLLQQASSGADFD